MVFIKKNLQVVIFFRYRWLDGRFVGTSTKIITKKLLLDQFLLTPPLLVVFYVGELNF